MPGQNFSFETPQGMNFGNQMYSMPPAQKSYVPNPNIVSNGNMPGIMVELGKALLKSAEEGDISEVKNLIGRGAAMTADWLDTSPLHKAALRGHTKMCKLLLSSGCSRDARTKVEKTALHLAATGGHSNVIELLLSANAEVNPKDMLDMSPLHWAVESGNIECVELLLRHGADVEIISKFDKTPLEIASDKQHTEIYEMLLNAESYRSLPALDSELAIQSILPDLSGGMPGDELLEQLDAMNAVKNDTIPMKPPTITTIPKNFQTVQIKQEGSSIPKVIQLNANPVSTAGSLIRTSGISGSNPGQPRVIRLSSAQLSNLKSANSGSFKGQKVMIVSGGANKVTNTSSITTAPGIPTTSNNQTIKIVNKAVSAPVPMASNGIKIVQVGNQPRKTIAITPNTTSKLQTTTTNSNVLNNTSSISGTGQPTVISSAVSDAISKAITTVNTTTSNNSDHNTKDNLKRKLEEMEEELERDRLVMEEKMAKIKKWKSELKAQNEEEELEDAGKRLMEELENSENILLNDNNPPTKTVVSTAPKMKIEKAETKLDTNILDDTPVLSMPELF